MIAVKEKLGLKEQVEEQAEKELWRRSRFSMSLWNIEQAMNGAYKSFSSIRGQQK